MGLTRYHAEDADGTLVADFITDSEDFAEEHIDNLADCHPGLTVTPTPEGI